TDFSYTPNMSNGLWHVYRFDRKTGELVQLTTAPDGGLRPTLSPDGKTLIYARRSDARTWLYLRDLASGAERVLSRELSRDDQEDFAQMDVLPAAAFTPDGRSIAYVTWSDADMGHVWKIRSTGGTPVRLSRTAGHYTNPAWSPKGDRIAVVAGSGAELRGQQPEFDPYFEIRWLPSEPPSGGAEAVPVTAVTPYDTVRFHPVAAWGPDADRIFFEKPIPPAEPGGG